VLPQDLPAIPRAGSNDSTETQQSPALAIDANREAEIKVFGVSIRVPLPRWAVAPIAVVFILGLIVLGGYLSYVYLINDTMVSRSMLNEYAENSKHSLEPNDLKENQLVTFKDGTQVTVNHFKSDGCFQIVRFIPALAKADGLWMFGPKLTPDKQSPIGTYVGPRRAPLQASSVPGVALLTEPASEPGVVGAKLTYARYNQNLEGHSENYREVQYGGHCVDPHPGPWSERPQQTAQCAVQVWRYFSDGCIHFQWFNPCSGTWDVYPNGAPHVYWQRCVH
jgi:hypothetical protein